MRVTVRKGSKQAYGSWAILCEYAPRGSDGQALEEGARAPKTRILSAFALDTRLETTSISSLLQLGDRSRANQGPPSSRNQCYVVLDKRFCPRSSHVLRTSAKSETAAAAGRRLTTTTNIRTAASLAPSPNPSVEFVFFFLFLPRFSKSN